MAPISPACYTPLPWLRAVLTREGRYTACAKKMQGRFKKGTRHMQRRLRQMRRQLSKPPMVVCRSEAYSSLQQFTVCICYLNAERERLQLPLHLHLPRAHCCCHCCCCCCCCRCLHGSSCMYLVVLLPCHAMPFLSQGVSTPHPRKPMDSQLPAGLLSVVSMFGQSGWQLAAAVDRSWHAPRWQQQQLQGWALPRRNASLYFACSAHVSTSSGLLVRFRSYPSVPSLRCSYG